MWNLLYSQFLQANQIPIPPVEISASARRIAILATSQSAKSTWNLALSLRQIASFNDFPYVTAQTWFQKIYLGQKTVIELPEVPAPYTLRLEIPYWFLQMFIEIWDATEDLKPDTPADWLSLGIGFEALNSLSTAIGKGTPVFLDSNGFSPAQANSIGKSFVVGLVAVDSVNPNLSGFIQSDGLFTATINQWDEITGLSGGLVPSKSYYLSPFSAGEITAFPPIETGLFQVRLGYAVSSTQLHLMIENPIGL